MVDAYWAAFFGCEVDLLLTSSETHLIANANQPGIWAITRRGGWVVAAPTLWCECLYEQIQICFQPNLLPNVANLARLLHRAGDQQCYGPAMILLHDHPRLGVDPDLSGFQNLTGLRGNTGFTHREVSSPPRPLTPDDQEQVAAFGAATPVPWSLAQPEIWVKVFGLFVADQLVAACGVRVWGDLLAEIYVDTLPDQRRQGYGKAVTSAALQWIRTETPYHPESVVELSNQPSLQLMKNLGFEEYAYMVMSF